MTNDQRLYAPVVFAVDAAHVEQIDEQFCLIEIPDDPGARSGPPLDERRREHDRVRVPEARTAGQIADSELHLRRVVLIEDVADGPQGFQTFLGGRAGVEDKIDLRRLARARAVVRDVWMLHRGTRLAGNVPSVTRVSNESARLVEEWIDGDRGVKQMDVDPGVVFAAS